MRYHIVPDDEEEYDPRRGPAADDPDGNVIPITAKAWEGDWFRSVTAEREDVVEVFRGLLKECCDRRTKVLCDRHALESWLHDLSRLDPLLSREQVEKAAATVDAAAKAVFNVTLSGLRETVEPDGRFRGLQ